MEDALSTQGDVHSINSPPSRYAYDFSSPEDDLLLPNGFGDDYASTALPHTATDDLSIWGESDLNAVTEEGAAGLPNFPAFAMVGVLGMDMAQVPLSSAAKQDFKRVQKNRNEVASKLWQRQLNKRKKESFQGEEGDFLSMMKRERELQPAPTSSNDLDKGRFATAMRVLAWFCFFICGIGFQIQYSSITSAIIYFQALYGPSIFRVIVAAFNGPLLPVLLIQLFVDQRVDACVGSQNAYRVRILLTMALCTGILIVVPFLPTMEWSLVLIVFALGVFNGLANGSYLALVSVFSTKAPIFFAIGQRTSTATILFIQLVLVTPKLHTARQVRVYFEYCAVVSAVGVLAFLVLIHIRTTRWRLRARDVNLRYAKRSGTRVSLGKALWANVKVVWPTMLSAVLTLIADVGVLTQLTYIPAHTFPTALPLILLYINYFSDFVGRQLTLVPWKLQIIRGQPSELLGATLRLLFVPLTIVYINQTWFINDWFMMVYISLYAVMGGYVRTLIFTIGPQAVEPVQRPVASLLLNIGMAMGVYLGILYAFTLGAYFVDK